MAIVNEVIWQAWANQTVTGTDLTSLAMMCRQVDAGIKQRLNRTIEQADYTGLILTAPPTASLLLGRYAPITVADFAVFYNPNAQGNPAGFTAADELTMYTDYILDVGMNDSLSSLSGIVQNLKGAWGVMGWRPNYSIAYQTTGIPGSLLLNFTGGYANVPQDLVEAGCLAVSKMRQLRKFGSGVQSESWNGDSYSLNGNAWMYGVYGDPVIAGILSQYENKAAYIG